MDQEGNMNLKFKQVLHLDTAGVWGGKHVDALRRSLKVQAVGFRYSTLVDCFLNLNATSAPCSHLQPTPGSRGHGRNPAASPAGGNRHPLGEGGGSFALF